MKKKLSGLKTDYRKELNKLKASYRPGTENRVIYAPPLWHYNELNIFKKKNPFYILINIFLLLQQSRCLKSNIFSQVIDAFRPRRAGKQCN